MTSDGLFGLFLEYLMVFFWVGLTYVKNIGEEQIKNRIYRHTNLENCNVMNGNKAPTYKSVG